MPATTSFDLAAAQRSDPKFHQNIVDVRGLATILKTEPTWVYSQLRPGSNIADPFPVFYVGKYPRFYVPAVMTWLSRQQPRHHQKHVRRWRKKPAKSAA